MLPGGHEYLIFNRQFTFPGQEKIVKNRSGLVNSLTTIQLFLDWPRQKDPESHLNWQDIALCPSEKHQLCIEFDKPVSIIVGDPHGLHLLNEMDDQPIIIQVV